MLRRRGICPATGRPRRRTLCSRRLVASAGDGAEATSEDPFRRRRNLRATNIIRPIQAKAAPKTRISRGIASMANFRDGAVWMAFLLPKGYPHVIAPRSSLPVHDLRIARSPTRGPCHRRIRPTDKQHPRGRIPTLYEARLTRSKCLNHRTTYQVLREPRPIRGRNAAILDVDADEMVVNRPPLSRHCVAVPVGDLPCAVFASVDLGCPQDVAARLSVY